MTRRECLKLGGGAALVAALPFEVAAAAQGRDAEWFRRSRRTVRTEEGEIAWVEHGSGPALLLLHGWPLNGFHWRGVMASLGHARRCIAPDFMGLGYSEVPLEQDLSPTAQARMIVHLMEALSINRADLIANDSGTAIAQLLAAHHPERVRTMLLTNGDVHVNSPPAALAPAIEAARRGELAGLFERHLADPEFAYSPAGLGTICYADPRNLTPEAIHVYFEPLLANPRRRSQCQAYGVAFQPNPLPAIEPLLRRFASPVRMVWGTDDEHFGMEWARWLDGALPGSTGVRAIAGGKLFFPEEHPEIVAEEALRLMQQASAPPS